MIICLLETLARGLKLTTERLNRREIFFRVIWSYVSAQYGF